MSEVTDILRTAGQKHRKVRIIYRRRDGKTVTRYIAPYEISGGTVFAECSSHGRIHEFRMARLLDIRETTRQFKPKWKVKL